MLKREKHVYKKLYEKKSWCWCYVYKYFQPIQLFLTRFSSIFGVLTSIILESRPFLTGFFNHFFSITSEPSSDAHQSNHILLIIFKLDLERKEYWIAG